MARPKAARRGKLITIYLAPARLDALGENPRKALYGLVDERAETLNRARQRLVSLIRGLASSNGTNGGS